MRLDFFDTLADFIDSVGLPDDIKSSLGVLGDSESVAIIPNPSGANSETRYYDGSRDKRYQLAVMMKHSSDRVCNDTLTDLYRKIENLDDLPSLNGSYFFKNAQTMNLPNKVGYDEKGLNVWEIDIELEIHINKGVQQ